MSGEWLTYRELAAKLGVSVEAARRRALRARWSRQSGNDGKARVLLPEDYEIERRPDSAPDAPPDAADRVTAAAQATIAALEAALAASEDARGALAGHVDTLKAALAGAEARAGEEAAKTTQAIAAFQSLAERLEAIAEARRPWWRRLVG
jgi:hypothetical protein